jgi:hypothetical protein
MIDIKCTHSIAHVTTLALGVASTLRQVKSKAPALQNKNRKAGALLLARRSLETTPSRGIVYAIVIR